MSQDEALGHASYWDAHYQQSSGGDAPTQEWCRSFSDLEVFFARSLVTVPGLTLADEPLLLHSGSGDSAGIHAPRTVIPVKLAELGYKRQLCVDFSSAVVTLMKKRHADIEGIEWRPLDVRDMQGIDGASVHVVFDKGPLDAMIHGSPWSPPQEVRENVSAYRGELHRVLKDDGRFLHASFRQPHFMMPLLNADRLWYVELQVLNDVGSFDYYSYVIRKAGRREPAGDGPVEIMDDELKG